MTAPPELPANRPDCTAVVDEFAGRLPALDLPTLRILLQVVQSRLGTAAEQPCDLERAQLLGHAINNRLALVKIESDLRRLGPLTDDHRP